MSNYHCTEQRHCDGDEMHEGDNIYCTKHFLSASAHDQIQDLESQLTAQAEELATLRARVEALKALFAANTATTDEEVVANFRKFLKYVGTPVEPTPEEPKP